MIKNWRKKTHKSLSTQHPRKLHFKRIFWLKVLVEDWKMLNYVNITVNSRIRFSCIFMSMIWFSLLIAAWHSIMICNARFSGWFFVFWSPDLGVVCVHLEDVREVCWWQHKKIMRDPTLLDPQRMWFIWWHETSWVSQDV